MKKIVLLCTLSLFSFSSWSYPSADSFDQDLFEGFQIVHPMKYPLRKKNILSAHYTNLVGDKFLSSHGIGIGNSYHITSRWAAKGSLTFFKHFTNDDTDFLKENNINPRMSNPSAMLRLSGLYQPFYGKITAGNYIQQFFVGVEFGTVISQEKELVYKSINNIEEGKEKVVFGPMLGVNILAPISKFYSLSYNFQYSTYSNPFEELDLSKNLWIHTFGVGVKF